MSSKGWIKLDRSIQDCWLWKKESFTKAQAWIDLLLTANHADKKISIDGKPVTITRGQFHTSTVKLADRWMWDRRKVMRFLDVLEKDSMIAQKRTSNGTTLTIVNYEIYQGDGTADGTTDGTTHGTAHGTTDGTTHSTQTRIKEEKNDKELKNERRESIPYQQIADTYNSICVSYPRLTSLSESRKKTIRARINSGYAVEDFTKVFEKAEESDFLKGKNDRSWSATFDWMIKDANMVKILDGNYDNKNSTKQAGGNSYMDAIKNRVSVVDSWV